MTSWPDPPAFRTGYMSILLPVETGEGEVRRVIRESVDPRDGRRGRTADTR